MDRSARVEIGEKLYVTAFMVILWADMVITIVGNGLHFAWGSVILGAVTVPVLLFLSNWLYTGNRTARLATLIFIAVQLLLAFLGLKLFGSLPGLIDLSHEVGPSCRSLATTKLLLYGSWGAMLLFSPRVQEFLNHQRGGRPEEEVVKITPTGTPVTLSQVQLENIGALGGLIQIAAFVAMGAGALQLVSASRGGTSGLFQAIEGVVMIMLGVFLLKPAASLKGMGVAGADMAHLTNALDSLAVFFKRQLVLVLIVALVLIAGILMVVI